MRCGNFIVKKPMVIGHECAGIIEEVGSEVKSLQAGDRVALEPGISCRQCQFCKGGRYNLCRQMKFFGSPPTNGALANLVTKHCLSFLCNTVVAESTTTRKLYIQPFFLIVEAWLRMLLSSN
ncbi:hypothetical protein CsSME_00029092 [Camellia sinensis var. sinensis]